LLLFRHKAPGVVAAVVEAATGVAPSAVTTNSHANASVFVFRDGGEVDPLVGLADAYPLEVWRRHLIDDEAVIVCFFVDAAARGRGLTRRMFRAAVDYARSQGARLLDVYTVDRESPATRTRWSSVRSRCTTAPGSAKWPGGSRSPVVRKTLPPRRTPKHREAMSSPARIGLNVRATRPSTKWRPAWNRSCIQRRCGRATSSP
jgi:GNAT superfamily N-acetyltransferase